jgi:hypothetical protein
LAAVCTYRGVRDCWVVVIAVREAAEVALNGEMLISRFLSSVYVEATIDCEKAARRPNTRS